MVNISSPGSKRVLIAKMGAIGDVIMAIPAVHALHSQGYDVDWICGPQVQPLLACYPWIRTIVIDDRALLKGNAAERARALLGLWSRIAGRQYAIAATLYYDPRYRVLLFPVRAERKLMLSKSDRELLLLPGRWHADEYLRILLGLKDTVRPESIRPVRPERLPPADLPPRRAAVRVALSPGGASNLLRQQMVRRWPMGNYVELARQLLQRGYEVLLLGGPEDVSVRAEFENLPVIDAVGALTLPEVIAACDTCDAVVTHDAGPLHLAGLSTAAVVGLFGPTEPDGRLPRREGVRGIWGGEGFACRPCYDGRDFAPCERNECMEQITVNMVIRQIEELLALRKMDAEEPMRVVLPSMMEQR